MTRRDVTKPKGVPLQRWRCHQLRGARGETSLTWAGPSSRYRVRNERNKGGSIHCAGGGRVVFPVHHNVRSSGSGLVDGMSA